MKSFAVNWKTTGAGVAGILSAAADIINQLVTGNPDANHLMVDVTGIITALGLIFAKDGNVTGGTVQQK